MSRPLRILRNALGIAALSVLLLEVVLRVAAMAPWSTPVFQPDEAAGFRVRPDLPILGDRTNSRGFHDIEHTALKPPGTRRLAFLGDSFVFGAVPRGRTLPSRFRAILRDGDTPWEVLNLGVPASGPETYLGLLRTDAAELGVDVAVVVFFVGNDLMQSHPDFETRIFFGGPRAVLRCPLTLRLSADHVYAWRLLRGGSRILRERQEAGAAAFAEEGGLTHRAFLEVEHRRLRIAAREPDGEVVKARQGAVDILAKIHQEATARGMLPVIVLAPDRFQVDADLRAELTERESVDWDAYDLDQPQTFLRSALEARGIPTLDLLPILRRRDGAELHLPSNTHWNARGNRVAAGAIHAFLDRLGRLAPRQLESEP